MRILIVKLGSIGDIIHTLPAVAAIRNNLPEAEISWVVDERSAEILRGNSLVDNLIEVDTHAIRGRRINRETLRFAGRQIKGLRQFKFDVSLDFQGLLKSAMIGKLSGAKRRWGFSREGLREPSSRLLLTDIVATPTQIHIIRKNLALAAGVLRIEVPDERFEFPIATSAEHIAEAEGIIESSGRNAGGNASVNERANHAEVAGSVAGGNASVNERADHVDFAILNPAGGWVTKLWHAEKFGQLADRLWDEKGIVSIVATGPKETELANKVAANSRSGRIILSQPSLKGFYELAKRARIYIGGDTGPTHIAVAAGTPIVGLFGPTEWWRNGSPNPADICVERAGLVCRVDCHRRTCSKWICMDSDVETVFRAVEKRLGPF